ncbi:unnamed protein product [Rhizoctonia solani]|uniref:Uncharacterized protein n=1 Tax=Rhizoctonia solani TaxID=456999 RepID=A0A8H3ALV1_9AGAM|nr:unnamed protein product [Rhizoctonia solani]
MASDTRLLAHDTIWEPHVAGIVAYLLSLEGSRTPAELSARVVHLAVPGFFNALSPNTTNLVAQLPA